MTLPAVPAPSAPASICPPPATTMVGAVSVMSPDLPFSSRESMTPVLVTVILSSAERTMLAPLLVMLPLVPVL